MITYKVLTNGKTRFEIYPQLAGVLVKQFENGVFFAESHMDSEDQATSYISEQWTSLS